MDDDNNAEQELDKCSDEEMSSQSSNSPQPVSEDGEEVDEGKIAEIQEQIKSNPYLYDAHVQLINLQRKLGNLDELRHAREKMSKIFPLSPELWLDWLTDEEKLAVTDREKHKVIALFERAVKDYPSVSVWLEYVQYIMNQLDNKDGIETIRKTFDRALTAVGIHVIRGTLIWEALREFECALLSSMNNAPDPSQPAEAIRNQEDRIYNIFKRQLSVPLFNMDKTFEEFKKLFPEKIDHYIEQQYKKATSVLEKLKPFEEALFESESPHLEEYRKYIQYEMKEGDPSRVQSIFERALIENCLQPDLWLEYTKYLDRIVKVDTISLFAHEKAVRNCPWSAVCWKNYAMAMERYNQPHDVIKGIYEKALASGFTEGGDFREMWLAYLDYLRRRIKLDEDHESELKDLINVFERATEHMSYYKESDPQCSILQYWAIVEAKYCKHVTRAREIWSDIMNHGHHGVAEMWLNFANFERLYGDDKHYRKLLIKGLHSANDWPESIGNALLIFEREEGTLETLDSATEKYEVLMQRVEERRQKTAAKEAERQHFEEEKQRSNAERRAAKKAALHGRQMQAAKAKFESSPNSDVMMDSDGFKIPSLPSRMTEASDTNRRNISSSTSNQDLKRDADSDLQSDVKKKQKMDNDESQHGMKVIHDSLKDEKSVFLSNLDYSVQEDEINEIFSKVGEIEEVRLVKDYKGRSKGFCYVVFCSKADAKSALKKDRTRLHGRPVFVSPCHDKKMTGLSQQKFKFGTGLEKNKLFIKGLSFETTEAELSDIFKEFGTLKEVRLVTYRNGHSKGLAYVEYEDEASAATALVKTDGSKVADHVISVAISNPPERKPKKESQASVTVSTLLGGGGSSSAGPRGRGRTQVSLLPRALQRPAAQQRTPSTQQRTLTRPASSFVQNGQENGSVNLGQTSKLSNDDFRNMLMKK